MATTVLVSDEVRDILKRCAITANSVTLPPGQLPRPLYEAVNKVFDAAGGRWDRKTRSHLFTRDPRELLGMVATEGAVVNIQQTLQAFYTPADLAKRMAGLARIGSGDYVLEPSAGEGALADACKALGAEVHCVEIDQHAISILKQKGYYVAEQDFLTFSTQIIGGNYAACVMNPPFARGAAVAHVSHALKFLKPGGRLVALMDAGVSYRTDKATTAFLDRMTKMGARFEKIPAGTFKESGTDVATVLVTATMPEE